MITNNAPAQVRTQPMLYTPAVAPERIGKYYVVHEVGRGSSGDVYLSHDPFYGRDVAIKVTHSTGVDDADSRNARRMFLGEANMIGKLHHPNIVPIYDAGEEDGRRYVVTEHVHGARTLAGETKEGREHFAPGPLCGHGAALTWPTGFPPPGRPVFPPGPRTRPGCSISSCGRRARQQSARG